MLPAEDGHLGGRGGRGCVGAIGVCRRYDGVSNREEKYVTWEQTRRRPRWE